MLIPPKQFIHRSQVIRQHMCIHNQSHNALLSLLDNGFTVLIDWGNNCNLQAWVFCFFLLSAWIIVCGSFDNFFIPKVRINWLKVIRVIGVSWLQKGYLMIPSGPSSYTIEKIFTVWARNCPPPQTDKFVSLDMQSE